MNAFVPTTLAIRAAFGLVALSGVTGLAASGLHTLHHAEQTATSAIVSLQDAGVTQPTSTPHQPEHWVSLSDYTPSR